MAWQSSPLLRLRVTRVRCWCGDLMPGWQALLNHHLHGPVNWYSDHADGVIDPAVALQPGICSVPHLLQRPGGRGLQTWCWRARWGRGYGRPLRLCRMYDAEYPGHECQTPCQNDCHTEGKQGNHADVDILGFVSVVCRRAITVHLSHTASPLAEKARARAGAGVAAIARETPPATALRQQWEPQDRANAHAVAQERRLASRARRHPPDGARRAPQRPW